MSETTDYLIIGKVIRPFGIRGEVHVHPITDHAGRFTEVDHLHLRGGVVPRTLRIERARISGNRVILKVEGVDTRDQAERLRERLLYVDREHAAELAEGSYYYYDLLGCRVVTGEGEELGTVEDIQNFGSCDVYFVRGSGGRELALPAIRQVIRSIDLSRKRIEIDTVEGLLE